jgi:DNA-binding PadR family transcriptional regulator
MSVRIAVLGLVIERPGYGYDLAQRLDERCGAWRWNTTAVYTTLKGLERDGYVRSRTEAGFARPAVKRTIYDATREGREHFREWMLALAEPAPVRQDLDLKLALATPELLPEMIALTRVEEQQCVDELQSLSNAQPSQWDGSWSAAFTGDLERNSRIRQLRSRIEWFEEVRSYARLVLEQSTQRAR